MFVRFDEIYSISGMCHIILGSDKRQVVVS